jgi:hypothetical protein
LFVSRCIKCGIPPKYISYNTWLLCDESVRGSGKLYHPKWGQTRVVFFPEAANTSVLKIALSGYGVISNKTEAKVSDQFVKNDGSYLIAPVTKVCKGEAVIVQKRIVGKRSRDNEKTIAAQNLQKEIQAFIDTHKLSFIITDIHKDNIAYDESIGKWVCIDYGMGITT